MLIRIRHENLTGFVDFAGRCVVPPVYAMVGELREDRVYFSRTYDDPSGLLDGTGAVVVPPRFATLGEFYDGLAPATERWKDGSGYSDPDGAWVIEPCCTLGCPFDGPRALAKGRGDAREKTGLLDRKGAWAVAPRYDGSRWWCLMGHGLFVVQEGTKWGVIDGDGQLCTPMKYVELQGGGALDGEPLVTYRRGKKWGYLKARTGEVVLKHRFEKVHPFEDDGHAVAQLGGAFGLIDASGEWVVPAEFDHLLPCESSGSRRAFRRGESVGVLGPDGVEFEVPGASAVLYDDGADRRLLVDGVRLFDGAGELVATLDLDALQEDTDGPSDEERLFVDEGALGVYLRAGLAAIRELGHGKNQALLDAIPSAMAPPLKALLIALAHSHYFFMSSFEIDPKQIRIHSTRVVLGQVTDTKIHVEYNAWRNNVYTTFRGDEGDVVKSHGALDSFFHSAWKYQLSCYEPADPTHPESHVIFARVLEELGGGR